MQIGIQDWIEEKKKSGVIRNIGFSYHGNSENFRALLDAYDWDFCQIQYNYLDEHAQAGREGLEYAGEKGIPVIIMEPLRGGRLVNHLPQGAREYIAKSDMFHTPAELALRWLWDQPQVNVCAFRDEFHRYGKGKYPHRRDGGSQINLESRSRR